MPAAEWVVAAYLGAAHTMSAPLSISQPVDHTAITLASIDYRDESFIPPFYYGYRVAFFPAARWFGVEGEFIHVKAFAYTDRMTRATGALRGEPVDAVLAAGKIVERFSMSHGLNFVLVNAVARHTLRSRSGGVGELGLTGRAGIGPTVPHAESTIGGASREGYELGAIGLQAAGGIEIRVWRRVNATVEYKFTRTRQTVAISGGEARAPLSSHHAVFGVGWHSR